MCMRVIKWINEIAPKVAKLIDRNSIIVHNVSLQIYQL